MTSISLDDLRERRRRRLAMAQEQLDSRELRLSGTAPAPTQGLQLPSVEETGGLNLPEIPVTAVPDPQDPDGMVRKKLWGQSVVDVVSEIAAGESKEGERLPDQMLLIPGYQGKGFSAGHQLLKVLDWSGKVAENVARPVIVGAQKFVIPGTQDLQRHFDQNRQAGMSFADALGKAYEDTNLEGPTVSWVPETAFTPKGSITIDFEDVIEAGFDPIDLALTLSTGGLGKAVTLVGKQGLRQAGREALRIAVTESRGFRIARGAARTIDDPIGAITLPRAKSLLDDVAPDINEVSGPFGKLRIAAEIPDLETLERQAFRKKSVSNRLEGITRHVPLARRIMGISREVPGVEGAARRIGEVFDPSQVAGENAGRKAKVIYENVSGLGANATRLISDFVGPERVIKAFDPDPLTGRIRAKNIGLTPAGARAMSQAKAPVATLANAPVSAQAFRELRGKIDRLLDLPGRISVPEAMSQIDELMKPLSRGQKIRLLKLRLDEAAQDLKENAQKLVNLQRENTPPEFRDFVLKNMANLSASELDEMIAKLNPQIGELQEIYSTGARLSGEVKDALQERLDVLTKEKLVDTAAIEAGAGGARQVFEETRGTVQPKLGDLMERALFSPSGRAERNSYFAGLTPDQIAVLSDYRAAVDQVIRMGVKEGVLELSEGAIPGRLWQYAKEVETGAPLEDIFHYVHRVVTKQDYIDEDGVVRQLVSNSAAGRRGGNRAFEKSRTWEFMEEGAKESGLHYADPIEALEALSGGMYRLVAEKRAKQLLDREGQLVTSKQVMAKLYPGVIEALENAKKFEKATAANMRRIKGNIFRRKAKGPELQDALAQADKEAERLGQEHTRLVDRYAQHLHKAQDYLDKARKTSQDGLRRKYYASYQRARGRLSELTQEVQRASSAFRQAMEDTPAQVRARRRLLKVEGEVMAQTNDLDMAEAENMLARLTLARANDEYMRTLEQIDNSRLLDARVFGLTDQPGRRVEVTHFSDGALKGSIAPKTVADQVNKIYKDTGNSVLRKIEAVTGTMRTLGTGFDVGWLTIQGLPLAIIHPGVYAKAAVKSIHALIDPAQREIYMRQNLQHAVEFIEAGGEIGSSEFFTALDRGGLLPRMSQWVLEKTEEGKWTRQAVEAWGRQARPVARAGTGFNMFLDVAKIEMWKGMHITTTAGSLTRRELATHINNMMGTMNTRLLGVGPTQRQIEGSLILFSPRYTRSAFALIGELMQSPGRPFTLDGLATRESMRAMGGFLAGGTLLMAGAEQAGVIEDVEYNPFKPGYLTGEIGGQRVGIGGAQRAILDLAFKSLASVAGVDGREISDLWQFNLFDPKDRRANPILQFWLNRTAPGVREALTRETFDGEKFDNPGEFALRGIAPKFLPFALQAWLEPPQATDRQGLLATVPETLGLRARPLSAFERRDKLRDQLAQATYGTSWDQAGIDRQAVLRRDNEELRTLEELAHSVENPVLSPYFNKLNSDQQVIDGRIANAVQQFRANPAGGRTFRLAYDEAMAQAGLLAEIREDPNGEFATALKQLEESKERRLDSQTDFDRLRDLYITQVRDNPFLRDQFGNPDFDAIDDAEQAFREKVGEQMYTRIRNYYLGFDAEGRPLRDTAPEVVALRRAREVLRQSGYWDVPDQVIEERWSGQQAEFMSQVYSEYQTLDNPAAREAMVRRFRELTVIDRRVSRERQRIRRRNPDVDRALVIFYGLRATNPEVVRQERALMQFSRQLGRTTTEGSVGIAAGG